MHIENVFSVFDGHSGLMISLEQAGFTVGNYFSSETDTHAIRASKACYPNAVRLGDVRNVRASDLPKIDLFGGGSPCQSFSFAGKRAGMAAVEVEKFIAPTIEQYEKHQEDEENVYMDFDEYVEWCEEQFNIEQSKKDKITIEILTLEHYLQLKSEGFQFEGQSYLFWEYMRLLKEIQKINPNVKFFLENVEMGKKWEHVISKAIGVRGIHINSAKVSAQNRKRIYWTNIGMKPGGLFGDMESIITQPKDRGILLKHILEDNVDEKYYISQKALDRIARKTYSHPKYMPDKTGAINTKNNSGQLSVDSGTTLIKVDVYGNPKKDQNKASCFTAGGHSGGNHSDMDLIVVHNTMPRSSKTGKGGTGPLSRSDGKTYCLDTGKTNAIEFVSREVIQLNPSTESGGQQPYQQNRVYSVEGIAPALCAYKSDLNIDVVSRIRRLTPRECGRLQTIPEHIINTILSSGVSDSQIYKMFGNGWNIETIVHIIKYYC